MNLVNKILVVVLLINLIGTAFLYYYITSNQTHMGKHLKGGQRIQQNLDSDKIYIHKKPDNQQYFSDNVEQVRTEKQINSPLPELNSQQQQQLQDQYKQETKPKAEKIFKVKTTQSSTKINKLPEDQWQIHLQTHATGTRFAHLLTENTQQNKEALNKLWLLQILYNYTDISPSSFNDLSGVSMRRQRTVLGIRKDAGYCLKSDLFNIQYPENVKQKNIMIDYYSSFVREQIGIFGYDSHPEIRQGMPKSISEKQIFHLHPNISVFVSLTFLHLTLRQGQEMNCYFQMYAYCPGIYIIAYKDKLIEVVNKYADYYEKQNKTKCFHREMFIPRSYRLDDPSECSQQYEESKKLKPIQFIRKNPNSHRGEGVNVFNQSIEDEIKRLYGKQGEKCSTRVKNNYTIVQRYIDNPLLVEGHKFDFRIYMIISSTDPLIVHYHDGFLRVSLSVYDINSNDISTHLTNTHLSKKLFKQAEKEGKSSDDLKQMQYWTFEELQQYLLENKIITDNNWLNNYLRPKFKKAFAHLVRMAQKTLWKDIRVYELLGVDFILDTDLNLWLLEVNNIPQISPSTEGKQAMLEQMLRQHLEIQFGILRGRTERALKYLNQYASNFENIDLLQAKAEFQKLSKNQLPDGFEEKYANSFTRIVDENKLGKDAYYGLLDSSCFV